MTPRLQKRRPTVGVFPVLGMAIVMAGYCSHPAEARLLLQDGFEGRRFNPLTSFATDTLATFTSATDTFSPAIDPAFGRSTTSGLLNDQSTTTNPTVYQNFAASPDRYVEVAFDLQLTSGDWGGWQYFVHAAEGAIVAQVMLSAGGFGIVGHDAANPTEYIIPVVPNVTYVEGHWYHISLTFAPPSGPEAQHTMGLAVTDLTAGTSGAIPHGPVLFYGTGISSGMNVFSISTNGGSPTYKSSIHVDNVRVNEIDIANFRYSYFPTANALRYWVNLPKGPAGMNVTGWTVTLKHGSTTDATQVGTAPFPGGGKTLTIPALMPGVTYTVICHFTGTGVPPDITRTFTATNPAWKGNTLGADPGVLIPPYSALTTTSGPPKTVSSVGKKHSLSNTGLWSQLTVTPPGGSSTTVLAGSGMTLGARINGSTNCVASGPSAPTITQNTATRVTGTAAWTCGALTGQTAFDYDYDGMMKTTLTVNSTTSTVNDFYLNIPLKDTEASLLHEVTDLARIHKAIKIPTGTGVVWNSLAAARGHLPAPFLPYLWVGGAERGVAWFAENDKDWIVNAVDPVVEVSRQSGEVSLKVHFVTSPSPLTRAHTITFGVMGTPAKPMATNPSFRKWWVGGSDSQLTRTVSITGTASTLGWGGPTAWGQFYAPYFPPPALSGAGLWQHLMLAREVGAIPFDSRPLSVTGITSQWLANFTGTQFPGLDMAVFETNVSWLLGTATGRVRDIGITGQPLVRDGIQEGTISNPLVASGTSPNATYTVVTTEHSSFPSPMFSASAKSGYLNDQSTSVRPALEAYYSGNNPAFHTRMSVDVKFASGSFGQWAYQLGGTNSGGSNVGYAVKVQPEPGVGFRVSLRATASATATSIVTIPVLPVLGTWYNVSIVAGPPNGNTGSAERTVRVVVRDDVGNHGIARGYYFSPNATTFPLGLNDLQIKGTDSSTSQKGALYIDNAVLQNSKPQAMIPYLNATAMLWDQDAATYGDEWSLYDVADPEWDNAVAGGNRLLRENAAGYNGMTSVWYDATARGSNNDMIMWRFNDMLNTFGDGAYLDDVFMQPDYNPVTGPGYIDDQGIAHPGVNIFGLRSLLKRISTLQTVNGSSAALTMPHMTNTNVVPYLSFGSVNLDLEWDPTANPNSDVQERYGLDADTSLLLAESTGLQSGNLGVLCAKDYAVTDHNLRSQAAVTLTHEMKMQDYAGVVAGLPALLMSFGYGEADCQVYRYWEAAQAGKVTVSDPRFKLLVMKRTSTTKALVIVGSYGNAAGCTLNIAGLAMPAGATATNYETGAALTKSGNTITVPTIPRHEFMMVLIQ